MDELLPKREMTDEPVTVVSGLPRSGTSMVMKMLEAGGMPLLVDNVRGPDEDNPRGYYEFERVKDLERDTSWVDSARGRAVKIVSPLLYHLRPDQRYRYKIIFLLRDLDEILSSQAKMVTRLQQREDDIEESVLRENYRRHLEEIREWLAQRKNIDVLYVDYAEVIKNPLPAAERIRAFLGRDLDVGEMARVIDESLYRQRGSKSADDISDSSNAAEKKLIEDRLRQLGYL